MGDGRVSAKAMTLRVPHALYLEMQAVARADGVSIAEFVREAVDVWIAGRKSDPIFVQHARQTAAEWQAFADALDGCT